MSHDKDKDSRRRYTNEATWSNQSFQNIVESYGRCKRYRLCKTTGILGNGLCQECWDRGMYRGRTAD